ncbi:hypothetical protein HYFRA_00008061 [Hymenoscyphus fraxineus]|uniref:Uncharacterized protein n=1 Tax=Hymenoscyphus fraxineus TaxID=746836 RepID=A0A9N9KQ39_9HELO|nr:hypothetical protein HYFRA_00008061 [Hymenoscyphus fraxineus]
MRVTAALTALGASLLVEANSNINPLDMGNLTSPSSTYKCDYSDDCFHYVAGWGDIGKPAKASIASDCSSVLAVTVTPPPLLSTQTQTITVFRGNPSNPPLVYPEAFKPGTAVTQVATQATEIPEVLQKNFCKELDAYKHACLCNEHLPVTYTAPRPLETVIFPEQAEIKAVKIYAKTENHTDFSTVPNWLRVVPNTEMSDAYTIKLITGKDAEKLATIFRFHNADGQLKATFRSRHGVDVVTDLLSYIPKTEDGITRNEGPRPVAFRHLTDNDAKESLWDMLKVYIGEDWNKNEDPTNYNYLDMISKDKNPYNMWTSCNDQLGVATRTWKNDYLKGILAKHPDPERTLSCSLAKLYPVSADEVTPVA